VATPNVELDSSDAPFIDGLREGKLLLSRCTKCGRLEYQAVLCACSETPSFEWIESSGAGSVHAFATFHQKYSPRFAELPYSACVVELDEGPLVPATFESATDVRLAIGLRVLCSPGDADELQVICRLAAGG
jgi:uncharacterized OB-fold protein